MRLPENLDDVDIVLYGVPKFRSAKPGDPVELLRRLGI